MTQDGRVVRGDQTRQRILDRAMAIASQDGLEGLSIGRLATDLGVSKSGLFAHFGSKEELQIAVVRAAEEVFTREVVKPALRTAPGLPRLVELCRGWLDYSERRVFPGGCFFYAAGAEFDSRPGRIRDLLAQARRDWLSLYEQTIRDAQQLGQLDADVEPAQLAFEFDALATAANSAALLLDDALAYRRSRAGIRARLRALATRPEEVP
ncbi:TetR/AcrR family transcriptional regulator [Streptosporangium sp. NPDC006013]|uniref:TetR/AcrR family transcriptional regulator n=1 Tax=Streptosporangium sp. NPDC006013 TaxID=3155596 RepID=UPI0033B8BD3E